MTNKFMVLSNSMQNGSAKADPGLSTQSPAKGEFGTPLTYRTVQKLLLGAGGALR